MRPQREGFPRPLFRSPSDKQFSIHALPGPALMRKVFHALSVNFHQPLDNLEHLLRTSEWEAKEILWAMDRITRVLWEYLDVARVNFSFSWTLFQSHLTQSFEQ